MNRNLINSVLKTSSVLALICIASFALIFIHEYIPNQNPDTSEKTDQKVEKPISVKKSNQKKSKLQINLQQNNDLLATLNDDETLQTMPIITININQDVELTDYKLSKVEGFISVKSAAQSFENLPILIKGRGNTSWNQPKKSFNLELCQKFNLLGMGESKEFALIANYTDKTLLRNSMAYYMGRNIFNSFKWSQNCRQCHVYFNEKYQGVYLLLEKITIEPNRVNIANLKDCKNEKQFEHFGYILEFNYREDEEFNFITPKGVTVSLNTPHASQIKPELQQKIHDYILQFEEALYSPDFNVASSANYYGNYIDVDSFIDWYFINEISKNRDARFFSSCYCYFDNADKLIHMGPLWDFDIGFGNDGETDCGVPQDFYIKNRARYFVRLFQDSKFVSRVKERWQEKVPEVKKLVTEFIPRYQTAYKDDFKQNFVRWPIFGKYVWPAAKGYQDRYTYDSEIRMLKDWLWTRIVWMDHQIAKW